MFYFPQSNPQVSAGVPTPSSSGLTEWSSIAELRAAELAGTLGDDTHKITGSAIVIESVAGVLQRDPLIGQGWVPFEVIGQDSTNGWKAIVGSPTLDGSGRLVMGNGQFVQVLKPTILRPHLIGVKATVSGAANLAAGDNVRIGYSIVPDNAADLRGVGATVYNGQSINAGLWNAAGTWSTSGSSSGLGGGGGLNVMLDIAIRAGLYATQPCLVAFGGGANPPDQWSTGNTAPSLVGTDFVTGYNGCVMLNTALATAGMTITITHIRVLEL